MFKVVKSSHPYWIMKDESMVDQYCVMVKTEAGFSQQISPWYFRKANAIRKYNALLRQRTNQILGHKGV